MKEKYITQTGNTLMVRVRGFKQENFHISLLEKAIARRNILCSQAGLGVKTGTIHVAHRVRKAPNKNKSSDLPIGLSLSVTKKRLSDGSGSTYTCIRAEFTMHGTTKYKMFSVERLGFEKAKKYALRWRKEKLLEKAKHLSISDRERLLSTFKIGASK